MTTNFTAEEFEQYLLKTRDELLRQVDAIESLLHMTRTAEIRKEWKEWQELEKQKSLVKSE